MKTGGKFSLRATILLLLCLGLPSIQAATIKVKNNNPSGPGSLFEALSTHYPGDRIVLDAISGQTINLTSPLPEVYGFVKITNSGAPVIIDGTNAGMTDGLVLASYSQIKALELRNFNGNGVKVAGPGVVLSDVATVSNSGSGVAVEPGANNTTVINLTSSGNTLDGIVAEAVQFLRVTGNTTITNNGGDGIDGSGINFSSVAPPYVAPFPVGFGPPLPSVPHIVISGNGGAGIRLDGATYNIIRGVYLGTDVTGIITQPNIEGGIILINFSYNIIGGAYPGQGNLISGNGGPGLTLGGTGGPNFRTQVFGNFFGTDINGTAAIGGGTGILIDNASENLIGGNVFTGPPDAPEGRSNLFSGNDFSIRIEHSFSVFNAVRGNYIGTDYTGTQAVGNGSGFTVLQAGSGNIIGGPAAGDGNVISGTDNNNPGLKIDQTSGTIIQGNLVGTDWTGALNLGNSGSGIHISQGSNNTIGGRNPAEENAIFFNDIDGVRIEGPNADNNAVTGNSIFYNAGQGVNLLGGANNLVAPPVVDSATTAAGLTTVIGSFTGPPNTPFFIDLYSNPAGQVGSDNQGMSFLGGEMFTTLPNGTGSFMIETEPVPAGNLVNAAKTDDDSNSSDFAMATLVSKDSASADLSLEKHAVNGAYSLTVENLSLSEADNVVVTDVVPAELTVTSCEFTNGSGSCSVVGNTVTATVGTIAATDRVSLLIRYKTAPGFPSDYISIPVKNTARVTSTTPDPNRRNNRVSITTRIGLPQATLPPGIEDDEGSGGTVTSVDRISTFDADTDGWTVSNTAAIHKPSGGNPGGFLFADNPETTISFLIAPPKFLGDLRAFNGGTLSFDGNMLLQNAPPYNGSDNYGLATITGNGGSASVDFSPGQPPEMAWGNFSKPMTAGTWGKSESDWQALLANVTSIAISIEARFGEEQQGIDNIKLLRPKPPVAALGRLLADGTPANGPEFNPPAINAGTTESTITVTIPEGLVETVTVDYETVDGTAIAGEDYVPLAGTLIFPPGTTSRDITIILIGDDEREADETFSVRFSNPVNAALETNETLVTILDDDGGFANISTRLAVGTGANVLIGGFIIPDVFQSTETKKVLLRAIGPSIPLPGTLADPKLELFDGNGAMIGSNDNWQTTQIGGVITSDNVAAIEASTIPPTQESESAMVVDLPPGAYTAILSGVDDSTGIGLVEAYDLDESGPLRLANISTRGFVQTGDDVMIGGLISLGLREETILARAIGPSLVDAGIPDALLDPMLELYNGDGTLVASNDNWRSDQESEIIATALAPADDADSAILATLLPGAYTGIVRGADSTTGVGLVEFYRLD